MSSRFIFLVRKLSILRFLLFLVFCGIAVAAIYFSDRFFKTAPLLHEVSPSLVSTGDTVSLHGNNFGDPSDDAYIEINNTKVLSKNCIRWTNTEIQFAFSEFTPSGLISVVTDGGVSDKYMIAHLAEIPTLREKKQITPHPIIKTISKTTVQVGTFITVIGEAFGEHQGDSQVLFTGTRIPPVPNPKTPALTQRFSGSYCSERDFDIKSWSDTKLQIRVPDGAESGGVVVITQLGMSNALPVTIKNSPGEKTFSNQRTYIISVETDVSDITASADGVLFLHIPLPRINSAQTQAAILNITPKPFVENYRGTTVHQLRSLDTLKNITIMQEYQICRRAVKTKVNPNRILTRTKANTPLYTEYTKATSKMPVDNKMIQQAIKKIIGKEKNPYYKAQKIYTYITQEFVPRLKNAKNAHHNIVTALEQKTADAYDMALLFCSFARASNIPAVPVTGIAMNTSGEVKTHCWAEFYLEGLGWIPVDPGMEVGLPFRKQSQSDGIKLNYFGYIDAGRIAFSRDYVEEMPMLENALTRENPRSYALRTIWEEASPDVTAYTVLWHLPRITAAY